MSKFFRNPYPSSMKLRLLLGCMAVFGTAAHAATVDNVATQEGQTIKHSGTQASTTGATSHFDGRVRVDPLTPATADIQVASAYVTFEPGAHSVWHTHPTGQYLIVTAGAGLTQEWGKPVQALHPGDVVWCPPGVKHWHGAAPDAFMTHLAITGAAGGNSVTWMERVTDAQYNQR
jgi:quercetin dioxygenase-like cupin family protein